MSKLEQKSLTFCLYCSFSDLKFCIIIPDVEEIWFTSSRLNITSEGGSGPGRTPFRSAGGDSSRKRRRVEETSFGTTPAGLSLIKQAASSAGYETTTSAKDVIEVSQIDPDAKFVKIYNSSAEKVSNFKLLVARVLDLKVMHDCSEL